MRKLMRLPEVIEVTGLPKSTIYNYISMGIFPSQVRIGLRAVGWPSDQIDTWIEDKTNNGGEL